MSASTPPFSVVEATWRNADGLSRVGNSARRDRGLPFEEAPIRWCFGSVLSGAQFDGYANERRGSRVDLDLVVAAERPDLKLVDRLAPGNHRLGPEPVDSDPSTRNLDTDVVGLLGAVDRHDVAYAVRRRRWARTGPRPHGGSRSPTCRRQ